MLRDSLWLKIQALHERVTMIDICIIGGGASGVISAISAHMENPNSFIHILEKNDKIGKKLLATGNGRCNFSNTSCKYSSEITTFFNALGIKERVEEQGRIYPYNGQAQDVVDVFESYLNQHNIKISTGFAVERLSISSDGHIEITSGENKLTAKNVLIATGGKAGPQFGSIGDGYKLAKELGHSVTKTIPALAPIECKGEFSKLKGVRVKATATLLKHNKILNSVTGEVQFTDYGLSGICIFNLSRDIVIGEEKFSDYQIAVDLIPDMSDMELLLELLSRQKNGNISTENLLISLVPKKLADFIFDLMNIDVMKETTYDEQVQQIAKTLKNLTFTVKNVKGWQFAQCTSGGIPVDEIDMDTMRSKIAKGLFFAGEVVDFDGPCGGFNLQNAWETGIKAGKAMAMNV